MKIHYVSISTFQLSPECGFPLQNSNILFSKISCKIQISRPVSKCDVGCLRSVGEAVSAEWPSWKWARICIPSVPLCIYFTKMQTCTFSSKQKNICFDFWPGYVLQVFYLAYLKKMQTSTYFSRIFLPGFACTPNGLCYTSYIKEEYLIKHV